MVRTTFFLVRAAAALLTLIAALLALFWWAEGRDLRRIYVSLRASGYRNWIALAITATMGTVALVADGC